MNDDLFLDYNNLQYYVVVVMGPSDTSYEVFEDLFEFSSNRFTISVNGFWNGNFCRIT